MRNPVVEPLSARQAQIAGLVAGGKSSRDIADALFLSPRTVENHIAAIFNKLGVGSRAELIAALLRAGPRNDIAAWAVVPAAKTNIPPQRTRLLAREAEVAAVANSFADNRLVTLTGAGGVGKTRTAFAVGEALLSGLEDGVWLVALAPLGNGSFVAGAIAQTFDVRESPERPLIQTLVRYMRNKRLLLIVDNCEHVIAQAAAVVDELLAACPQLQVLATSREPLRIAGEQTYRLPSLPVPSALEAGDLDAAAAAKYASVALFVQRAQACDRAFVLSDENASSVADICRRLEGIPLAIELAAARVNMLTVRALSNKLEQRFSILTGGERTALPRHQTMGALIDWSYDLLLPAEQRLFERLSIFAGGCDLAAAAAIHADKADEAGVFTLLSSLIDKSLAVADLTDREPRYRLLEPTRQYARLKLEARGEAALIAHRHAAKYLEIAERLEEVNVGAARFDRAELEFDVENWRAALNWTLEAQGDIVLGQRLAAATRVVWTGVSYAEGQRWLDAAVALIAADTPALVIARLEYAATGFTHMRGKWELVVAQSRPLIPILEKHGAAIEVGLLEFWLGKSLVCLDRVSEGETLLRNVLERARSRGYARLAGRVLENICYARSMAGDLGNARACILEACRVWNSVGDEDEAIAATLVLAEAEFRAGNGAAALEIALDAVTHMRVLRPSANFMTALINLAAYLIAGDRWSEARDIAREALGLRRETQRSDYLVWALQHAAAVAALSIADDTVASNPSLAARLLGYVDARLAELRTAREYTEQHEYGRMCGVLHGVLGAAETVRLMEAGATLTEDQAVLQALSL